jgi:hypothetical protein
VTSPGVQPVVVMVVVVERAGELAMTLKLSMEVAVVTASVAVH